MVMIFSGSRASDSVAAFNEDTIGFPEDIGEIKKKMQLYSFFVPSSGDFVLEPEYRFFRIKLLSWNKKMADRFWSDPALIGLENLSKKNDRSIELILESIP